ncbi:MAG: alpha/beta hydrolase [Alphaproteobacteria bacterium]|nr:alpha/beta hydrolase [Alphaproteobacteria bacterium]
MIDPEMEQQYNNRANVPEHPGLLAEWAAKSAAWEAEAPRKALDIVYGDSGAEMLDLFFADAADAPVHMYIHGGYWQSNTRKSSSFVARPLVDAGVHVAVVDYALCPAVTIDEIGRQIRAALAWLWREAERFGGDPDRITVSGHSCGGQLVGTAMATDWGIFAEGLPHDLVKGGVSISGVFDLAPLVDTSINDKVGMDPQTARRNSPLFMKPATQAPLALYWGGDETDAFRWQSESMAESWGGKGAITVAEAVPGTNHFTVLTGMDNPTHPATRGILRQIGRG